MQVIGYLNRSRQGGTGIPELRQAQLAKKRGYAGKILDGFHFSEGKEATLADYLAN